MAGDRCNLLAGKIGGEGLGLSRVDDLLYGWLVLEAQFSREFASPCSIRNHRLIKLIAWKRITPALPIYNLLIRKPSQLGLRRNRRPHFTDLVGIVLMLSTRGGYYTHREQKGSCSGTEESWPVRGSRGGQPSHFQASDNAGPSIGTASKKGIGHRFGQQDTQAGGTQMKFTIAIEAGTKKTAFGVVVPDLPGRFSAGDTITKAERLVVNEQMLVLLEWAAHHPKLWHDIGNDPAAGYGDHRRGA
jgi:hypothetical protein